MVAMVSGPFCLTLGHFGAPPAGADFVKKCAPPPCPKIANFSVSTGSGGPKSRKVLWSLWSPRVFHQSAMVTPMVTPMVAMVTSFFPKAPRPDHSDHSPTISLTIALLLPNKRATIVTIALFWVLARGARDTGQNGTKRDIWSKWDKIVLTLPLLRCIF